VRINDGQRVVVIARPDGVVLTNRRGGEITGTLPRVAGMAEALAPHAPVLGRREFVVGGWSSGQGSRQHRLAGPRLLRHRGRRQPAPLLVGQAGSVLNDDMTT
jgi:ATP-dependent DNA ligase